MTAEMTLLELEERFWKGDAGFYHQQLAEHCLMVFPGTIMDREQVIASITAAPRWSSVRFDDPRTLTLGASAKLLVYSFEALREGDEQPYRGIASSAYVRQGGGWLLSFHQQTPGE